MGSLLLLAWPKKKDSGIGLLLVEARSKSGAAWIDGYLQISFARTGTSLFVRKLAEVEGSSRVRLFISRWLILIDAVSMVSGQFLSSVAADAVVFILKECE